MAQKIFTDRPVAEVIAAIQQERSVRKLLVVCDTFCQTLDVAQGLKKAEIEQVWFDDFIPNPLIESVNEGVRILIREACDAIIAIGGGSGMDVAKCIKLYAGCDPEKPLVEQTPVPNEIPLIALPTTAGTGSEATRYAVAYYQGNKQSITSLSIIPEYVIFRSDVLQGLPLYQKKCTVMDALCHAIESFWSVGSTEESKVYSRDAIRMICASLDDYLAGDTQAAANMLHAANIAGKAINITQTTAGHAMCYKVTSLYKIPHGHAAALCVRVLWPYMLAHKENCVDQRGAAYLEQTFQELAEAFGFAKPEEAADAFDQLVDRLGLERPVLNSEEELKTLAGSVNPTRLKNNPVALPEKVLYDLYRMIVRS